MDLNEKIKLILEIKNISPSHFADEIGIQRASISHILAGRNKPSLDIVQKVIRRFPDLGFDWIMDENNLPLSASYKDQIKMQKAPEDLLPKSSAPVPTREVKDLNDNVSNNQKPEAMTEEVKEKKIERILILYTDGSFQEFKS